MLAVSPELQMASSVPSINSKAIGHKLLRIQKVVFCLSESRASRLVSVSVGMYVCILVHTPMHTRILKLKLKAIFWEVLSMFVKNIC